MSGNGSENPNQAIDSPKQAMVYSQSPRHPSDSALQERFEERRSEFSVDRSQVQSLQAQVRQLIHENARLAELVTPPAYDQSR